MLGWRRFLDGLDGVCNPGCNLRTNLLSWWKQAYRLKYRNTALPKTLAVQGARVAATHW
ncbi:MAG: hypothetical protein CM1200mP41_38550 [Gammaproteobacteria bacterium]|nr:MAG: hypothetical protein CM1200mP41_38550 [Gammaproteobacteria bacterium]